MSKIQGILNVTPDSFSDGGKYLDLGKAVAHAESMVYKGADMIDVGGESTRPGSERVTLEEELKRVLPVVKQLIKKIKVPISIDTYKPIVAERCLDLGVQIVNDVTGLSDEDIASVAAKYKAGLIIGHLKGSLQTMKYQQPYFNLIDEIKTFLYSKIQIAYELGVKDVIIDPGFGFAKIPEQNMQLLEELSSFKQLKCPIMIGVSRKSFVKSNNKLTTYEALVLGVRNGADIVRVHDIDIAKKAIKEAFVTN